MSRISLKKNWTLKLSQKASELNFLSFFSTCICNIIHFPVADLEGFFFRNFEPHPKLNHMRTSNTDSKILINIYMKRILNECTLQNKIYLTIKIEVLYTITDVNSKNTIVKVVKVNATFTY